VCGQVWAGVDTVDLRRSAVLPNLPLPHPPFRRRGRERACAGVTVCALRRAWLHQPGWSLRHAQVATGTFFFRACLLSSSCDLPGRRALGAFVLSARWWRMSVQTSPCPACCATVITRNLLWAEQLRTKVHGQSEKHGAALSWG